ncbi:MAG: penicillin-insensitive murein endopeptidase [Bdellovibrionia bacterium]
MKTYGFVFGLLLLAACAKDPNSEMSGQRGPYVHDERPTPPLERPVEEGEDTDTTQGAEEQAIGFYSKGKMTGSNEMPMAGYGFLKIQRPRMRHYATFDLIYVIDHVSKIVRDAYPRGERLQIGDVANKNGGQCASHASHQNGLDADIVYFRRDNREMNPDVNATFDEDFVKDGKVTENFDLERNWALFTAFVRTGRVKRMFVDVAIKKAACAYAKSLGLDDEKIEILRRLRLEPLHDDHVHVRITCPNKSPNCQQQLEPPEGSGCDGL